MRTWGRGVRAAASFLSKPNPEPNPRAHGPMLRSSVGEGQRAPRRVAEPPTALLHLIPAPGPCDSSLTRCVKSSGLGLLQIEHWGSAGPSRQGVSVPALGGSPTGAQGPSQPRPGLPARPHCPQPPRKLTSLIKSVAVSPVIAQPLLPVSADTRSQMQLPTWLGEEKWAGGAAEN